MSTLYVSDLDGTLLRSDQSTSEYTDSVINSLVEKGMNFSYATARSIITAKKATLGIKAKIPLIVYNGAFVVDNVTGQLLLSNFFDGSVLAVLDDLFEHGVYPIVYAFIDGRERFSFAPTKSSQAVLDFNETRKGDRRCRMTETETELMASMM